MPRQIALTNELRKGVIDHRTSVNLLHLTWLQSFTRLLSFFSNGILHILRRRSTCCLKHSIAFFRIFSASLQSVLIYFHLENLVCNVLKHEDDLEKTRA